MREEEREGHFNCSKNQPCHFPDSTLIMMKEQDVFWFLQRRLVAGEGKGPEDCRAGVQSACHPRDGYTGGGGGAAGRQAAAAWGPGLARWVPPCRLSFVAGVRSE